MSNLLSKFAISVAQVVDGTEGIRGKVIVRPTRHLVRGFLFEKTTVKGVFYMWRMVVPLFSPAMSNISLNYSDRISFDGRGDAKVAIGSDSAATIREIIDPILHENIPYLGKMFDPDAFLREFEPKGDFFRPNIALDFAIANCLAGNKKSGRTRLSQILALPDNSPIIPQIQADAKNLLDALASGDSAFADLVSKYEDENVTTHFQGITRG